MSWGVVRGLVYDGCIAGLGHSCSVVAFTVIVIGGINIILVFIIIVV
jgi:hypothetical protein